MVGKIMVTGSSGTIGTRLCEKLIEKNYDVQGVDKRKNAWNKKINAITTIADLTDEKQIKKLSADADIVVHLAANARVYNLVIEPQGALENISMLFNMLEFCRKNKIKKFIFASSREVYGNSQNMVYKEDDAKISASESPYSASKVAGEALVNSYKHCYGIDFIITRFSNVYGMYDDSDRVVPLFIRFTRQGKDLMVFGEHKELDFTYIDDTVQGIICCIEKFDGAKNEAYNIATGKGVKIIDCAKMIQKRLNSSSKIPVGNNRTGEVVRFVADISKAKKALSFEPTIGFEEGLARTIEWYLK